MNATAMTRATIEGVNVKHDFVSFDDVTVHYVTAGQGEPLVLLHGWPETWFQWRHIIGPLSKHFLVIAPDLRGLGDTTRPETGYDKRTISQDIFQLVHDHLGFQDINLVGHDWGGPVAFSYAAAHRDAVRRLAILDVTIPGDGTESLSQGGRRWHHGFHRTENLPEALITGREEMYLSWFYQNFSYDPNSIDENAINEYLRTYTKPDALRAGFSYYRAIPQDIANNQDMIRRGGKLTIPVLGLGGDSAWGRGTEVIDSLKRVAQSVQGTQLRKCGHFIAEEKPKELVTHLLDFFDVN